MGFDDYDVDMALGVCCAGGVCFRVRKIPTSPVTDRKSSMDADALTWRSKSSTQFSLCFSQHRPIDPPTDLFGSFHCCLPLSFGHLFLPHASTTPGGCDVIFPP